MIHAAAPCPIDVKQRMIGWWGPVIDEYYAASEGGGTVVTTAEWLAKPGTVGKPWPISEIAIFDDEGSRFEASGEIGTVYMAMQTGDFEYHKDKEKTESNRIGKFFTVGDIGFLDEDGFLFLCDRKTDMIISGGANIYLRDRERAAHASQGRRRSGLRDPQRGLGRRGQGGHRAGPGRRGERRARGGDPLVLLGQAGQVQDAQVDRLHRRDAS